MPNLFPQTWGADFGYGGFGGWGYSDGTRRRREFGDDDIDKRLRDPREFGWWGEVFEWESWGGFFGQLRRPTQVLMPSDKKEFWDCLRNQFEWAKAERAALQKQNAFSVKPSASTLVSALIGVGVGLAVTKSPVGGAIGGVVFGASTGVAKDVLADNIVRGSNRFFGSIDIRQQLDQRLHGCYRQFGYEPPSTSISESIGVLFR
jgi:hypothetical protein